jgi:hypothetical protein
MAIASLDGKIKIIATKVLQSPQGEPRAYCVAEVHFPWAARASRRGPARHEPDSQIHHAPRYVPETRRPNGASNMKV